MRTSKKILLLASFLFLFITAIIIINIGIFLFNDNHQLIQFGKGSSTIMNKEYAFDDFNAIDVKGFWKVEIKQTGFYSINVSGPEYAMEHTQVDTSARLLRIHQSAFADIPPVSLSVLITMPELTGITSGVNSRISFSGFNIDNLTIETSGYSNMTGTHSQIHNLFLTGRGITKNDLSSCTIVNAHLALAGTGNTTLNMAGGTLSGYVQGTNEIIYSGSISEQTIKVFDTANITKKENQ